MAESSMLKTCEIIIPSLGRLESLKILLESISSQIKEEDSIKFSVLISLNLRDKSKFDYIKSNLQSNPLFQKLNMRFVQTKKFLGSADESTLSALENSSADFVWLMGDDDALMPGALKKISAVLSSEPDTCNFYYLNSKWVSPIGGTYNGTALNMSPIDRSDLTFGDFVFKTGFNYGPGGLSRIILRRTSLNVDLWREAINKVAPVWSMLTAFAASFWNSPIYIVGEPIVFYRLNDYHIVPSKSWAKFAQQNGLLAHEIWINILMSHIFFLENAGILRLEDFNSATISESMFCKTFEAEILEHLYAQFRIGLFKRTERFSTSQLSIISAFLMRVWPQNFILVESMRDLMNSPKKNSSVKKVFTILRNTIKVNVKKSYHESLSIGEISDYRIIFSSGKYLAIHESVKKLKVISLLFPDDYQPILLSAKTLVELQSKIIAASENYSSTELNKKIISLKLILGMHGGIKNTFVPRELLKPVNLITILMHESVKVFLKKVRK